MTWSLELWKITLGGLTSCREIITRRMGRTVTQIGNKNSVGGVTFEFAGTDSQGRDRWKCHRCWNIIRLTRVQTKHRAQGRVCLAHLALDTCSESGRQAHVEHRLVPTAGDAGVCIVATGVLDRAVAPKTAPQKLRALRYRLKHLPKSDNQPGKQDINHVHLDVIT